ncbi:hypothetical protein BEN47_08215 [Hymenobacter lapidarius]|uniref:DUF4377 domain-containing protein n=1 Tax=Hymenobacter lapidarius TaxID=1908237 RepID=A0A1G1TDZ5_9BACT|nr:hypothetical protein BEN47_08215 [Hymenobacter lapidarius]
MMITMRILALVGLGAVAMSNSCQKEEFTSETEVVTARVVRIETTVNANSKNPRPRWVVDIAPLELPGWTGRLYTQAKVFDLPDTLCYGVGTQFTARYKLTPQTQQTPWATIYEWYAVPAEIQPPGAVPLPELVLTNIVVIPIEQYPLFCRGRVAPPCLCIPDDGCFQQPGS